ncbi:tetratricopeptide repeat protein [Spiractinospora alimapuensis]|uniref:tetratricopeptide repeat protein n=1 Tax=Spiractinospora alimapuensis TaxID=2820884 RepID=UPI001F31846A|nr:tetratricopeptide repeat protein [Spiractinospora alimapuensis]QVQ51605.1 tetratricopeptide repeat protein [Spiractinospora alimapuensis]
MPDPASAQRHNSVPGSVHGTLLQVGDVHGSIHLHDAGTPPKEEPDVCLDAPRLTTPIHGRHALLEALDQALTHPDGRPRILTGPGGIGKSTVAAALAEKARNRGVLVFWIRPGSVAESMLEMAVELGGDPAQAARLAGTPRRAARWVWRTLASSPEPWLLVFDNVDQPAELDPENAPAAGLGWLRGADRGLVVVTTRVADPVVWTHAATHSVAELDPADAAAALADHAGLPDSPGAAELAQRLGGFPLALSLAGRAVATHHSLFADFDAFHAYLGDVAARLDTLAQNADPRQRSMASTWTVSTDLLASTPHAAPLFDLLALLGANGTEVPVRRLVVDELRGGPVDLADTLDETTVARAINALTVQGLITIERPRSAPVIQMHPLIAEIARSRLGERAEETASLADRLLRTQRDRDLVFEHAGHTTVAQVRAATLGEDHSDTLASELARSRAMMLRRRPGMVDDAAALARRAATTLGPEHPVALQALHHHGDALAAADELAHAADIYTQEWELRRRLHGPDSDGALGARHQLAMVALKRGDLDTAKTGFSSLVAAKEATDGPLDTTVLFARVNLGCIAMGRGDHDDAEACFQEVLARWCEREGPDHPDATDARYHLGWLAWERGDTKAAERWLIQVTQEWESSVGPDDPRTELARGFLATIRGE